MIKNLRFLIFLVFAFQVQAQQGTIYQQLLEVNKEWAKQPDASPSLKSLPSKPLAEQDLVKLHLQETEQLLRQRKRTGQTAVQWANRLRNLDVLHQYWLAGRFPINTHHANRQPYFIDDFGTYCAVGYLIKESGAAAMAQAIHNSQNYSYLADIHHPELADWVENSGLSFSELALIQPTYGGEWPATITEMHYNNTGTDVSEYLEVHQVRGLVGNALSTIRFYNFSGSLYKTLSLSEMQSITTPNGNQFYYYSFPSGDSFADSGKVVLFGGISSQDTISVATYNSRGLQVKEFFSNNTRNHSIVESEATPVGNSLTFCGLYYSTWATTVQPATVGTINPCTVGALPVTLLSFDYKLLNSGVQLNWKTASETNSSHFEIERSANGSDFRMIGQLAAAGNSSGVKEYSLTDVNPQPGNYYRLRQVDKDGRFAYSTVLYAQFKEASPLMVVENPVKNKLTVFVKNVQANSNLLVYDLSGKAIFKTPAKAGNQYLDVSGLSSGKYVLILATANGQVYNSPFIKQ